MKQMKKIATPRIMNFERILPAPKFSVSRVRGSSKDSSSMTRDVTLKSAMYRIAARCIQRATDRSVGSRV